MVEEDSNSKVEEPVTNGTMLPEKEAEKVADNKEDGVKKMEEDKKDENDLKVEDKTGAEGYGEEKADEVKELDEDKDPKAEATEEEKSTNENEKDVEMTQKSEGLEEKNDEENDIEADKLKDEEQGKESGENKEDVKEGVKESGKEKEKEEKAEEKEEQKGGEDDKSSKKRSRRQNAEDKEVEKKKKVVEKEQEPRTPTNRPVRERKSVERLVATIEKDSSKEFHIEKGGGTMLEDIPNVAYKLARKRNDETYKLLHMVLYGRRGKATEFKHNVSRFSGFVWHDNEDKQRLKIKEKLDKYVKEKLLEFCDVLDIPITKAASRKEDIIAKLIDFLVAPHATTTELLAEKDQGKKRKRSATNGASVSASPKSSAKSRKKTGNASINKGKKTTPESDDESQDDEGEKENGVAGSLDDEKSEQSGGEEKKDMSENDSKEDTPPEKVTSGKAKTGTKKKTQAVESPRKAATKPVVTPRKARSVPKGPPKKWSAQSFKVIESAEKSPKVFSRKKKDEEPKKEKSSASKKSATKDKPAIKEKSITKETSASKDKSVSKEKSGGKKAVIGKEKSKQEKLNPSDDELRNAISDILKEVDFNTATFTDILKQLGMRFKSDLVPRKTSIKHMIQDELTKLAEEDEGDEGDAEKNDAKPAGKVVET